MIDLTNVGQGKTHGDPTSAYDDAAGHYDDPVHKIPDDERYPMKQMPKGPDPSPFSIGPMQPGGRGE